MQVALWKAYLASCPSERVLAYYCGKGNAGLVGSAGFTYELCAGLIDKAKNMKQICKEEIEEEG